MTGCRDYQDRSSLDTSPDHANPLYSGAAYEDDKQGAHAAGAQGYLIKPIGIERLIDVSANTQSKSRNWELPLPLAQASTDDLRWRRLQDKLL